jgi:hypothetical protein
MVVSQLIFRSELDHPHNQNNAPESEVREGLVIHLIFRSELDHQPNQNNAPQSEAREGLVIQLIFRSEMDHQHNHLQLQKPGKDSLVTRLGNTH